MQSQYRPEGVRDMLSLGPLLSDKLSSRLRGQDRPNCLTQKELPFEAIGIADARPTPVGPTREGSKPVKRSTGRGKPVAPTFECVDAYASLFDTNKNSRVYASTYFAQPGSSFMRLFERQKKLIDTLDLALQKKLFGHVKKGLGNALVYQPCSCEVKDAC